VPAGGGFVTDEQFKALDIGDIVRIEGTADGYVIVHNEGETKTAVRVMRVTNPREWLLVSKSVRPELEHWEG
jgi:hypothetical protein